MSPIEPTAIRDVYVVVRREQDVLLMLRDGTGYKDGYWGLPSGKVGVGETYGEAAVRELAEETGLQCMPSDLRLLLMLDRLPNDGGHWVGAFFELASGQLSQEPRNAEPSKCRELGWYPLSNLPHPIVDYVGDALRRSMAAERYAVWEDP